MNTEGKEKHSPNVAQKKVYVITPQQLQNLGLGHLLPKVKKIPSEDKKSEVTGTKNESAESAGRVDGNIIKALGKNIVSSFVPAKTTLASDFSSVSSGSICNTQHNIYQTPDPSDQPKSVSVKALDSQILKHDQKHIETRRDNKYAKDSMKGKSNNLIKAKRKIQAKDYKPVIKDRHTNTDKTSHENINVLTNQSVKFTKEQILHLAAKDCSSQPVATPVKSYVFDPIKNQLLNLEDSPSITHLPLTSSCSTISANSESSNDANKLSDTKAHSQGEIGTDRGKAKRIAEWTNMPVDMPNPHLYESIEREFQSREREEFMNIKSTTNSSDILPRTALLKVLRPKRGKTVKKNCTKELLQYKDDSCSDDQEVVASEKKQVADEGRSKDICSKESQSIVKKVREITENNSTNMDVEVVGNESVDMLKVKKMSSFTLPLLTEFNEHIEVFANKEISTNTVQKVDSLFRLPNLIGSDEQEIHTNTLLKNTKDELDLSRLAIDTEEKRKCSDSVTVPNISLEDELHSPVLAAGGHYKVKAAIDTEEKIKCSDSVTVPNISLEDELHSPVLAAGGHYNVKADEKILPVTGEEAMKFELPKQTGSSVQNKEDSSIGTIYRRNSQGSKLKKFTKFKRIGRPRKTISKIIDNNLQLKALDKRVEKSNDGRAHNINNEKNEESSGQNCDNVAPEELKQLGLRLSPAKKKDANGRKSQTMPIVTSRSGRKRKHVNYFAMVNPELYRDLDNKTVDSDGCFGSSKIRASTMAKKSNTLKGKNKTLHASIGSIMDLVKHYPCKSDNTILQGYTIQENHIIPHKETNIDASSTNPPVSSEEKAQPCIDFVEHTFVNIGKYSTKIGGETEYDTSAVDTNVRHPQTNLVTNTEKCLLATNLVDMKSRYSAVIDFLNEPGNNYQISHQAMSKGSNSQASCSENTGAENSPETILPNLEVNKQCKSDDEINTIESCQETITSDENNLHSEHLCASEGNTASLKSDVFEIVQMKTSYQAVIDYLNETREDSVGVANPEEHTQKVAPSKTQVECSKEKGCISFGAQDIIEGSGTHITKEHCKPKAVKFKQNMVNLIIQCVDDSQINSMGGDVIEHRSDHSTLPAGESKTLNQEEDKCDVSTELDYRNPSCSVEMPNALSISSCDPVKKNAHENDTVLAPNCKSNMKIKKQNTSPSKAPQQKVKLKRKRTAFESDSDGTREDVDYKIGEPQNPPCSVEIPNILSISSCDPVQKKAYQNATLSETNCKSNMKITKHQTSPCILQNNSEAVEQVEPNNASVKSDILSEANFDLEDSLSILKTVQSDKQTTISGQTDSLRIPDQNRESFKKSDIIAADRIEESINSPQITHNEDKRKEQVAENNSSYLQQENLNSCGLENVGSEKCRFTKITESFVRKKRGRPRKMKGDDAENSNGTQSIQSTEDITSSIKDCNAMNNLQMTQNDEKRAEQVAKNNSSVTSYLQQENLNSCELQNVGPEKYCFGKTEEPLVRKKRGRPRKIKVNDAKNSNNIQQIQSTEDITSSIEDHNALTSLRVTQNDEKIAEQVSKNNSSVCSDIQHENLSSCELQNIVSEKCHFTEITESFVRTKEGRPRRIKTDDAKNPNNTQQIQQTENMTSSIEDQNAMTNEKPESFVRKKRGRPRKIKLDDAENPNNTQQMQPTEDITSNIKDHNTMTKQIEEIPIRRRSGRMKNVDINYFDIDRGVSSAQDIDASFEVPDKDSQIPEMQIPRKRGRPRKVACIQYPCILQNNSEAVEQVEPNNASVKSDILSEANFHLEDSFSIGEGSSNKSGEQNLGNNDNSLDKSEAENESSIQKSSVTLVNHTDNCGEGSSNISGEQTMNDTDNSLDKSEAENESSIQKSSVTLVNHTDKCASKTPRKKVKQKRKRMVCESEERLKKRWSRTGNSAELMKMYFSISRLADNLLSSSGKDESSMKAVEATHPVKSSEKRRFFSAESNYICAVCHEKIEKSKWPMHNLRIHNNLAWRQGEKPLDLNDQHVVIPILTKVYKKFKRFYCDKCKTTVKSVLGFLSHIAVCGRTEEEIEAMKVSCPQCSKKLMPVAIPAHIQNNHSVQKTIHWSENEEDKSNVSDKRHAAKKALDHMAAVDTESDDSAEQVQTILHKYYVRYVNQRQQKFIPAILRDQLTRVDKVRCLHAGCDFLCDNVDVMIMHLFRCPKKPQQGFICKVCLKLCSTRKAMVNHLRYLHDIALKKPRPNADCKCEYPMKDKRYEILRKGVTFIQNKRSRYTKLIFQNGFWWTIQLYEEHLSNTKFEKSLLDRPWSLLPVELLEEYLPQMSESCDVARLVYEKSADPLSFDHKFKKYELFESEVHDDGNCMLFCGGPISAIAWLPTPLNVTADQILAVSILKHPDDIHYTNENYKTPGVIQFWNFGKIRTGEKNTCQPTLAFGLAVDFGPVWHMEWCPSGCYNLQTDDAQLHLGMLAVASADSAVYIYSVPAYNDEELLIYRATPVKKLSLQRFEADSLSEPFFATKISWCKSKGNKYIAVGYSNGICGLFNLGTTSSILMGKDCSGIDILYPYLSFQAHMEGITGLHLYHLNDPPRWLMTTSKDRAVNVWDLTNLSVCMASSKKAPVTDGLWLSNFILQFIGYDEGAARSHMGTSTRCLREMFGESSTLLPSSSTVTSLTGSDWLTCIMEGDQVGSILAMFGYNYLSFVDDKYVRQKRMLLGYTVLIDKNKTPDERVALQKQKQAWLKEEIVKPTAVVKHEQNEDNEACLNDEIETNDLASTFSSDIESCLSEPFYYHEAQEKYGLVFCDANTDYHRYLRQHRQDTIRDWSKILQNSAPNLYPLQCVNKLALNPNHQAVSYYAAGYQAGFVKLNNLDVVESDVKKLNKLFENHLQNISSSGENDLQKLQNLTLTNFKLISIL